MTTCRCSVCGGRQAASEFIRRIDGRLVQTSAPLRCIERNRRAEHAREKKTERWWNEGPKQERRTK